MRWSEEDYQEFLEKQGQAPIENKSKKKTKYNNKRIRVDGILFDSQKEANYYGDLKLLLRAKEIKGFCRQPEFILQQGNTAERAITYKADFIVFNLDDTAEVIDVKGFESQQWKRTFKMFRLKYPEIKLKIVK